MLMNLLSNRPKSHARSLRTRLQLEPLEERVVLSAPPLGPEFLANLTAPAEPNSSYGGPPPVAIASDAAGNFVVVWSSFIDNEAFPGDYNIYAQRFDAVGNALGTSFQVNAAPAGGYPFRGDLENLSLDVAMNSTGEFAIVFTEFVDFEAQNVILQRYDANGNALGTNVQVDNDETPDGPVDAFRPRVSVTDNGSFAVAYVADVSDVIFSGLFLQQYDAGGSAQGDAVRINSDESEVDQGYGLSGNGSGTYFLAWDSVGERQDYVYVARFDGNLDVDLLAVVNGSTAAPPDVAYARTADQGVVVWTESSNGQQLIRGQLFTADLETVGSSFAINQIPVSEFTSLQPAHVATSPDGQFRVVWVEGSTASVTAATFGPGGVLDASDFIVNTYSFHYSSGDTSDITVDANGNFVIAYSGFTVEVETVTNSVFARIYRNTTVPGVTPDTPFVATPLDFRYLAVSLAQEFQEVDFIMPLPPLPDLTPFPQTGLVDRFNGRVAGYNDTFRTVGGTASVGQISGKVFEDINGNGIQDPGETGMGGVFVFLDLNKNGRWDEEEPSAITDRNGDYLFENLRLDRYLVIQDLEKVNVEQTSPPDRKAQDVTLSPDKPTRQEVNFADKQIAVAQPTTPPFVGPIEPKKDPQPPSGMTEPKSSGTPAPSKPPKNSDSQP